MNLRDFHGLLTRYLGGALTPIGKSTCAWFEGMPVSKYRLPPLDLLHTFEAVARHRSFTLAADELCLTQSAVSRQIKTLEDALGLRLFRRLHRAIDVTPEGQRLFESVTRAMGMSVLALQHSVQPKRCHRLRSAPPSPLHGSG